MNKEKLLSRIKSDLSEIVFFITDEILNQKQLEEIETEIHKIYVKIDKYVIENKEI